MYVMIDNFDSFVYNLKAYFQELGERSWSDAATRSPWRSWKS